MIVYQATWGAGAAYRDLQKLSEASLRLALPGAEYRHVHAAQPAPYSKLTCALEEDRALVVDVDLVALRPWVEADLDLPVGAPVGGVRARFKELIARRWASSDRLRRFVNGGLLSYGVAHRGLMARAISIGARINSKWYEETALNLAFEGEVGSQREPVLFPVDYNSQVSEPRFGDRSYHCNLVRRPADKLEACRDALRRCACDDFRRELERQGLI